MIVRVADQPVARRFLYEHRSHKLLPWPQFLARALRHIGAGAVLVFGAVATGTVGYHVLGSLPWVDAFLNASMILSGMGPVDHMDTALGKIFSALYALFSGLVFIGVVGLVLAPWAHRLFHRVHLEEEHAHGTRRSH